MNMESMVCRIVAATRRYVVCTAWGVIAAPAALSLSGTPALADPGPNHQVDQRPTGVILMGTTGGSIDDLTRRVCCAGTLGSVVVDADPTLDRAFILSNNHVIARTNEGILGEQIVHPGLIDNGACLQESGETVAVLADFVPISFRRTRGSLNRNTVDAAIATVTDPRVSQQIIDIGFVFFQTIPVSDDLVGLRVKKSGRTTGLSFGTVDAVGVSVTVTFGRRCGQGRRRALFVDQIRIGPGGFSASGDSGSLVVEDVDEFPRPVGLLFAGSETSTFANPIDRVLECLGVGFPGGVVPPRVDCTAAPGIKGAATAASTVLPADLTPAAEVRARHEQALFARVGVVGSGISRDRDGDPVIEVYLESAVADVERPLPADLEGIPVRQVVTGPVFAF